jgi:rapamycin-insensitive companion of mTOR
MLEYSFQHSDRLSEALKTKWVRRVSGFYRCSVEEKGYFANLEWEPTNLQYLECACNLYSVLLRDEIGLSFLSSDRRGMLFNEMAQEIEQLVVFAASKTIVSSSTPPPKNVFRMYSCNCLMAREFFTLLGRIVRNPGSKKLLEYTNLFDHLSRLGQFKSLDYVTRLAITSLCFTDSGLLSRHLLQMWTTSPTISSDFRGYLHNLLRLMVQSASSNESFNWSIEAVVNQLSLEDVPDKVLFKALEEAVHSKSSLRIIIGKRPRVLTEPDAQHLVLRFLSVPEGISYAQEKNWLEGALTDWNNTKCAQYVLDLEDMLCRALTRPASDLLPEVERAVDPIPVRTPEIVKEIIARQGGTCTTMKDDSTKGLVRNVDPNAALSVDLQGFLRVPWNIEIKLFNSGLDPIASAGEYLRVDTFLGMMLSSNFLQT